MNVTFTWHVSTDHLFIHIQVETRSDVPATNGAVREKAVEEDPKQSPKHTGSSGPKASTPVDDSGRAERARTLSARSFDPLPEIPKLDTAEDGEVPRSKDQAAGGQLDDDEAGYAYARVGGAAVGRMEETDSDKEDKAGVGVGQGSGLPPYGKVSHHGTKAKVNEAEEYAEVKEVFRGPAAFDAKRVRSATDPIDPTEAESDNLRERRAFTHTQMPLPAVPRQHVSVDESEMYDSIPDDMRDSQVQRPQTSVPAPRQRPKERLYESMDDMEDTYESVPDNLKPDSPSVLSPVSPSPSPTKVAALGSPTAAPPIPPSSPIPKPKGKEPEKKALEKTLSAAQAEDGKRRFSFFGRKKTASVSAVGGRKKEKEKEKDKHTDKDHKEHHIPQQPLPDVPSSPPVMSPPLPPIPAINDDEDTMYDTPQLDFMSGPPRLSPEPLPTSPSRVMDAKTKSQSLPMSARGAGASVIHGSKANVPLPRVPEDSGQGMVVRERVLESPLKGEDEEKPYDSVKVLLDGEKPYDSVKVLNQPEYIDEPNYDTVDPEEVLKAVAEAEGGEADPGYDRIRQRQEQESEEENEQEQEKAASPQPIEEGTGIRYGKVTRPLSPENETPGIIPEHDEEGYAVVPEDFKMRKRAMSASIGVQQQTKKASPEPSDNSIDKIEEAASPGEPAEPSEPYATIDIIAKKEAQKNKKDNTLTTETDEQQQRSSSPVPPPVPPVGDLGDLREYSEPPIPVQSEGIHELLSVDNGGSSTLKPPGSDDPPYAKVKSKDHPYAELNLGNSGEVAKLATPENEDDEAGYDEVGIEVDKTAALKDKALGYDTVTDPEVNIDTVEDEALGYDTVGFSKSQQSKQESKSGYDTVIDSDKDRSEDSKESPRIHPEQELPKLESAEVQQPLYDGLEPVEKEEKGKEEAGNLYDSLEAAQPQNGVSSEELEEERYEEIDEDRRMQLIMKQKQWSESKSS